jgi:hypothetical protein
MDNDSTRNGGLLSLVERAKQGHLLTCATIDSFYIAVLRYPSRDNARIAWNRQLIRAIEQGKLPRPNQTTNYRFDLSNSTSLTITGYHISKRDYREYLVLQQLVGNPIPAESLEYSCWLGATPATESIPPIETSLPEPPASPARPASVAKPKKWRRDDALTHAIRAALAVLSPNGGPLPSPRELFDYLKESDSTRTITGLSNDGKALMWAGKVNDSPQKANIRLLAARLSRWQS